jgi:hypothetical protein
MQTEKIVLGEREYVLQALPLRRRRLFVDFLMDKLGGVFDLVGVFETLRSTSVSDLGKASDLLQQSAKLLLNSPDIAADLLYAYSPEIAADKEYIEDNALDEQAFDGFIAITGLMFSFLEAGRGKAAMEAVRYLFSQNKQTGMKSVSANGASGQTNSTSTPEIPLSTPG